ncbi:MAG TPA: ATP-dependent zinc metalloprotease FtsH [bacterium]|nr:ATP-dependent zinc metalloprotease FtsH [bacterium]
MALRKGEIWKSIISFLLIFAFLGFILSFDELNLDSQGEDFTIRQMIEQIDAENVKTVEIKDAIITVTLNDDSQHEISKEYGETFGDIIANYQIPTEKISKIQNIEVKTDSVWYTVLMESLPFLIPLIFGIILVVYFFRQVQGSNNKAMSFGQSKVRKYDPNKNKNTFKDVAGAREAKEELKEIVEFLKEPKKFRKLGAKIPKGVLLMGSPGTGKTLLARSIAGEANVPFFIISGSEFVEMFVGVGASRVRDLFTQAKLNSPCIVFIDEIDAVGRQRGSGLGGSHDEREQTLNQILVEMDGFDENVNVIVIAATNRPDILDPALLRPGRFDRRITLDLPDIKERIEILELHAKNKPMAEGVDLKKVAARTVGFSGADLANLLNEAAILTARHNETLIKEETVLESIEKVLLGPARKSRVMSEREKKITAYHEAGHAVVGHFLEYCDPIQKVSIISRGRANGYTLNVPDEDRSMKTKNEFKDEIAMLLGGRMVEKIYFKDVTTGASSDLERATADARAMVTRYGMSDDMGLRTYGKSEEMVFLGKEIHEQRNYSEKMAEAIDNEINVLIKEAADRAEAIIKDKKDKIEELVKVLLEKEIVEKEDFLALMGPGACRPDKAAQA